jgi:hypothetical protein
MRPSVVSRLAAQFSDRRPPWRIDWIRVAFVLAVALLSGFGVFMNLTG